MDVEQLLKNIKPLLRGLMLIADTRQERSEINELISCVEADFNAKAALSLHYDDHSWFRMIRNISQCLGGIARQTHQTELVIAISYVRLQIYSESLAAPDILPGELVCNGNDFH